MHGVVIIRIYTHESIGASGEEIAVEEGRGAGMAMKRVSVS